MSPLSPLETSPTNSYRSPRRRRRSSTFSSNHDRSSPVSLRSRKRFSNASQYSNDFSPGVGDGGGNLADELDQLEDDDDGEEFEGDVSADGVLHGDGEGESKQPSPVDGARDSGIDVSYASSRKNSPRIRNFSKPFCALDKPPDEQEEAAAGAKEEAEVEEKLSPELEDAMNSIARMTSYTSTTEDPLIPRLLTLLQDLPGNQSTLEASTSRLATSTNSLTSHLSTQTKAIQTLTTTLYTPFSTHLDPDLLEETTPLLASLLTDLPVPDPAPLQALQKLTRDTNACVQTLSHLADTLQIFKQATNSASRHLRTTQAMVAELRRERERADDEREELARGGWGIGLRGDGVRGSVGRFWEGLRRFVRGCGSS